MIFLLLERYYYESKIFLLAIQLKFKITQEWLETKEFPR